MKKKLSVIAVIILVLAICVSAWFYGYYNHKSNDNLPTLAAIAEMSEADVNNLLPGYRIDQLREVWGKPDTSENGTACWKIENDTILVVSYKNNGIVAICGLKDDSGTSIGEYKIRVYQGEHLSIKNGSETNDDHCTDHGKDDRLFRREYP